MYINVLFWEKKNNVFLIDYKMLKNYHLKTIIHGHG